MIGIIYVGNILNAPYLEHYINALNNKKMNYEIIWWNRSGNRIDLPSILKEKSLEFSFKSKQIRNPLFKIKDFFLFRNFALSKIRERKYNKLIVLTTMSGIILQPFLTRKYSNNYIFDYRDAGHEYFLPFYLVTKHIINNSYFTSISSRGFLKVLPKNEEYIVSHNFVSINQNFDIDYSSIKQAPYKIGYVGGLRQTDYMKKLIDSFGDDERFLLFIHGGGENIQEVLNYSNQYNNVIVTGSYHESEKEKLLNNIDMICYNYPSSFNNDLALANKFYDGLIYKKPMLGNIKTYSGQFIFDKGIGLSLSLNDPLTSDKTFEYLNNFNYYEFDNQANLLLKNILSEQEIYINKINDFLETGIK